MVLQSTVAIRETFGKFDSILDPGCHFMPWCVGKSIAGYLTLRLQQLDVRCETKTKVSVPMPILVYEPFHLHPLKEGTNWPL
jgi:hypothetical protein